MSHHYEQGGSAPSGRCPRAAAPGLLARAHGHDHHPFLRYVDNHFWKPLALSQSSSSREQREARDRALRLAGRSRREQAWRPGDVEEEQKEDEAKLPLMPNDGAVRQAAQERATLEQHVQRPVAL